MNKIRFNSNLYDSVIIDGNIELQSLSETIIFEGGGLELTEDAEREFYSLHYAGQRINSFISEFIEDRLQCFIDSHSDEAEVITHFIN